ncbi:MAG: prepilin peptidase [Dethiobacter sp.]|nr:prepilin peptidase [Dethiobacter sp.]MBS3990043.1 prepilin peptidase [Dethiobacter sp.]
MITWAMFLFLAVCLVTDLAERKIYNVVVITGLAAALVLNLLELGLKSGLLQTFSGFFTGILLLFIPFVLGGIGAGDVKMLGTVGAFLGSSLVVQVMLASAVAGGAYALIVMLNNKCLLRRLRNICRAIYSSAIVREKTYFESLQDPAAEQQTIPYGAAITAGVIIIYLLGSMNNAFPVMVSL